jgi:hypothetical protein
MTSGEAAARGVVVNVNVAGSVTTERQLVDAIQAGLLRKQSSNVSLGFN